MTTNSGFLVTRARRLGRISPALVLPAVAAELVGMFRFHNTGPWLALLAVAVVFVAVRPALAVKVAPFVLFAYGFGGILVAHALLTWQHTMIWYGFFQGRAASNITMLVLPEAFAFMAAALWLLAATGGPGGNAVRKAVRELLGTGGTAKTVPALLLLPVLFLWEETLANPLWYGPGVWRVLGVVLVLGAFALVRWRPRVAAVGAVLGLIVLGLIVTFSVLNGWDGFLAYAQGRIYGEGQADFYPAAPGVFSGMYGLVALENQGALWLIRAEGLALIAVGGLLAPRVVGWAADPELARRAAALMKRVERLDKTRSDATDTAVAELRRIERDLHDGAQARLVAVGMSLRAAEQLMPANPDAALALLTEARETSSRALDDLRNLVRGIYPPVLADRGLADAVQALALDAPIEVTTDITLTAQPPMPVAAAVYFGIAEALTNAVRHSGADTVQIGIGETDGMLRATIVDDGAGGADQSQGTGLSGVERRLATFDGILAITSPPGGPTIIVLEVPCTPPRHGWGEPGTGGWLDVVRDSWQTRTLS